MKSAQDPTLEATMEAEMSKANDFEWSRQRNILIQDNRWLRIKELQSIYKGKEKMAVYKGL